jgi:alkylation response protein AidB-like acyl-CoA dehydrogenase
VQFELSDEERMLQEAVADFGRSHFGGQAAPRTADADWRTPWDAFAKLGMVGILVPEDLGGAGGTVLDSCLIAEQLAHADAWVPFAGTAIAGAAALLAADDTAARGHALTDLAEGGLYSLVVDDRLRWPAERRTNGRLAFDWRPGARGLSVRGGAVVIDELDAARVVDTDPMHPLGVLAPGDDDQALEPNAALARALAVGRVGLAAWLTGVASVALEQAVSYAKERQQFGVPIGSFQAVQHLCADMLVDVETSRSIVYGAAWSVDNESAHIAERAVLAAKSWCSRAAVRVCETSIQVFGGIGVTWEHPAHLRLRTATQFAAALGSAAELDRGIGAALLAKGAADGSR